MPRTGLRLLTFTRILPLALMWIGIGLSGYLGDLLQDRAGTAWREQAERETALQTATLQDWIDRSLTALSGLALLVDNSPRLDGETFLEAAEGVLGHAGTGLVPEKALLENKAGRWLTRHQAGPAGAVRLLPAPGQPVDTLLANALVYASENHNSWFMSAPFEDALGKQHT